VGVLVRFGSGHDNSLGHRSLRSKWSSLERFEVLT
jgi:hypothetical protein